MPTKTKVLIAGAVLALGAAVPAIAQAGGDSATVTSVDGTQSDQDVAVVGSEDEAGAEDQVGSKVEEGSEVEESAEVEQGADDESEADDEAGQADEASAGDSEAPIPATDIDRASAAALAYLGNGLVTATEVGDEESYYEVEVTRDDGTQVDVQLDENFNVVSTEDDGADG